MKSSLLLGIFGSLILGLHLLHAQDSATLASNLEAIEQTTPTSADSLPEVGTYWSAQHAPGTAEGWPPFPTSFGMSAWPLGNNVYLLDDIDFSYTAARTTLSAGRGGMHAMDDSIFPDGYTNSGSGSSLFGITGAGGIPYNTNGLWLQISNDVDGVAYLNLYNATDYVYVVLSTTTLSSNFPTGWQVETEVFPTDTNCMPFTVENSGRSNLFLYAEDWTGVTENGNTTPDWWFWNYYNTVDLSDTNISSLGETLLYCYTNDLDPNVIQFSFQFPDHVTANTATGAITLWAGIPADMALLVNDTNTADAVWRPYDGTNIVATLGGANGTCTIYVGLRGLAPNAQQTWEWTSLILDATPAFLVVTNPAAGIVTQPVIQLQGYASEGLSNLTFDVSNAMGVLADQPGLLAGQFYDTNLLKFTTNYFQCYDIALTNGLNTVTLHATLSSGQTVTTNASFTLDYSGDVAPVINLTWPQDGASIGGDTFTLRGVLNNDTASVSVSGLAGGPVAGIVGRDGQFWVENLPLTNGDNTLTVTATDAAGNSSTTNITVSPSDVTLTINPLSDDDLRQPAVSVYGTVSDPGDNVWVNGVEAYVDDEGNWEADGVPVNGSGIAAFDVIADGEVVNQSLVEEMPSVVQVSSYQSQEYDTETVDHFCDDSEYYWVGSDFENWTPGSGGAPPAPPWVDDSENDSSSQYETDDEGSHCNGDAYEYFSDRSLQNTLIQLVVGGHPESGEQRLVLLTMQVTNTDDGSSVPPSSISILGQTLMPSPINAAVGLALVTLPAGAVRGITPVISGAVTNYTFNVQPQDVTLQIIDANTGANLTTQTNTVIVGQQMNLVCQLNVTTPTNTVLTNFSWTVPGYAISNFVVAPDSSSATVVTNFPLNNSNVVFYWVDGASNRIVQVSATVNGATVAGQAVFNVLKPSVNWIGSIIGNIAVDTNYWDGYLITGLWNDTWLHFGDSVAVGSNVIQGITFTETNFNINGPTGQHDVLLCVQLVVTNQTEHCVTNGTSFHTSIAGLDTTFPYSLLNDDLENVPSAFASDAPGTECRADDNYVTDSDNFKMYLMYQSQDPNSIPVPLKMIAWNWSGSASASPAWNLVSSNATITANNMETAEFPQWTQNTTNSVTVTNNICN